MTASSYIRSRSTRMLALVCLLPLFLLAGCPSQITFQKVDKQGHVLVQQEHDGYCFRVPPDWEIRENLEGTDAVCMGPFDGNFRETVISASFSAASLENPGELIATQLEEIGESVKVLEPYRSLEEPVVVAFEDRKRSDEPLVQFLYLHRRGAGDGVMLACTTLSTRAEERQSFFDDIFAEAKFTLEECPGPGGVPEVFPTPEVIFNP